ncbi:type III secretion system inner membrane ring subunit SctD [Paraburkholderia lacunae]|uniref:EscD/YscD/HrpQ family type III secretion system inner membrane ring protein n=1 Tax=Paraburkholderia lacunae TaxID=2211104 RepID=A0A370MYD8_9BURK|nr:type III secretion system inner membrane ring subunit SctD [Paraburkholderia lacunae]RDJ98393.1 EscD/YscD/HrpQ family type III secretion system inner membrane ring protein [Paraburkholderia lacunae]
MQTSTLDAHAGAPGLRAAPQEAVASPWNLCFLSGPMYGRTMSLARGANWVGTAADCEVILPDREIGARQVCLQVGALAVTVQNHGGPDTAPVLFNDEPLAGRRSFMPGDVVTVGSIKLGIASNGQAAAPLPADGEEVRPARDAAWLGWAANALRRLGSRRSVLVLVALWVGVLLGALGYGLVALSGSLPWQHESPLGRVHRLQQALRAYPELAVAARDDGELVSGYVKSAAERDRVAQIVAGVDNAALGTVYIVGDLIATAQTYFSDTPLKVSYLGRGRIEVTGEAPQAQIALRLQNYVKDARPALEVVDHIHYADERENRAATLGGTGGVPEIATVFAGDDDQRFIETADGSRYFEGARMKDGLSVASISPEAVVFERDGRRITIPLTAGGNGSAADAPTSTAAASTSTVAASGAAAGVALPVAGQAPASASVAAAAAYSAGSGALPASAARSAASPAR